MPTCIKWGVERYRECTKSEDQGKKECSRSEDRGKESCTRSEDRGYEQCSQTRDDGYRDCCGWWPCSWACKWISKIICIATTWIKNLVCVAWAWVKNIVCVAWTWIKKIVCVAWTWITTALCVMWDVVTTIINVVLVTIESILGYILSTLALFIEFLEMIPVLGTLIRWIINGITTIINVFISIPDAILGLVGIRPEKKLRICTVILKNENEYIATKEEVIPLLQLAADIYKRDSNVRLIPSKPFRYNTGFSESNTVDSSWIINDNLNSFPESLDVPCEPSNEWLLGGTRFQIKSSTLCFFGSWRRVLGYGSPITCFVIREVIGDSIGCSLFITDYVTVDRQAINTSPRTIAHEIGHSSMLWHLCVDDNASNLMANQGSCNPNSTNDPERENPVIDNWQTLLIRASKHVSYF